MNNATISPAAADARNGHRFPTPRPNATLMWVLGFVNRALLLRGRFRVRAIDLPEADRTRLRRAVNRKTAAFLAPNHPEFGFDWIMDKEISTYVAPRMASWAAREIVAGAPWFWTRNNLIANDGGDAATAYSVDWAMRGRGVLAHPEGMVHWTADKIHPLFSGVAEMAVRTARGIAERGERRPVYVAPLVWKLRYTSDVSSAIHREMTRVEHALGLRSGAGQCVADRFYSLQTSILLRQMKRFGFDDGHGGASDCFFNRQSAFRAYLIADLQSRYRVQLAETTERTIHRLSRAIAAQRRERPDDVTLEIDASRVKEAERLGGFSSEVYGTPVLTQEQICESLKRIRATLLRGGLRNALHNMLPKPFGARTVHVRVPEPSEIDLVRASGDAAEQKAYAVELIQETRARMQATLDAINAEIATEVAALSHPNPFAACAIARAA